MESSEDDAGNATRASCRASAREKDVGLVENDNPTCNSQLEPPEASASIRTPTMSEDNFDGDSVPSPSAQDVNTSTEAILDMIDEFVDGPGAPKRLPFSVDKERLLVEAFDSTSDSETKQPDVVVERPPTPPPASYDKVEIPDECIPIKSPESAPSNDPINVNTSSNIRSPQNSPIHVDITVKSSNEEETENICAVINAEPQAQSAPIVSDSPSSSIQSVQNTTNINVCDESKQSNRTLKCVTSSDNRDCVTVERAESTSSECSVSESKDISVEVSSKLPLKRRLVRPALGDKRPDSTVSSTVDSQAHAVLHPIPSTSCDVIVKDVSSSSDAVTLQHSNKPEEISNVSEISICKAETSTAPRKIRLIRSKATPALSISSQSNEVVTPEKEQCQSTSSDEHVATVAHTPATIDGAQKKSPDPNTESQLPSIMINSIPSNTPSSINKQSETLIEGSSSTTEGSTCEVNPKEPEIGVESKVSELDIAQSEGSSRQLDIHSNDEESNKQLIKSDSKIVDVQKETNQIESQLEDDTLKQSKTVESDLAQVVFIEPTLPHHEIAVSQKVLNDNEISVSKTVTESSVSKPKTEGTVGVLSEKQFDTSPQVKPSGDTVKVLEQVKMDHSSKIKPANEKTNCLIQPETPNEKQLETSEVLSEVTKSRKLETKIEENKPINIVTTASSPKLLETQDKQCESSLQSHSTIANHVTSIIVNQSKPHHVQPMDVDSLAKHEISMNEPEIDQIKDEPLEVEKKLPPIKLTLMKVPKLEKKSNDLSISKKDDVLSTSVSPKPEIPLYVDTNMACDSSTKNDVSDKHADQKKVPPIKLSLSSSDQNSCLLSPQKINAIDADLDSTKQVPKLTIKLGNKHSDEMKSPVPKLTIKAILPPSDQCTEDNNQQIPNVTKLNIKPIVKPIAENESQSGLNINKIGQTPSITKLNIKPIPKPAERVHDMHRKSSSSEISESEYSENDETSTSDQASASEQGTSDTVPKVTIKLGRPGTESEGKFYTEKNIPKLTIKGIQQNENDDKDSKLTLVVSQSEELTTDKIPKLTIKTKTKADNQPLSPKLTIKPTKPIENENEIPKLKITSDMLGTSSEIKENMLVPKLTIKAVSESDALSRTPKKSTQLICDSSDHIPTVTKLNIKPVLKPLECGESSEDLKDTVPVVSKLNIKPIVKPINNEVDSSVENVPKIKKLNIKPLKNPEENSSEEKDCDEIVVDKDKSIPVVTKINIKPIVKPDEDDTLKDSENQSSETGTSSDENSDHIPIVTKLNIKPILKPSDVEEAAKGISGEPIIPVITKLNIKPIIKPDELSLPLSPKKESLKSPGSSSIPTVTKLNIKPILKPEGTSNDVRLQDDGDKTRNPPLVMKINMKNVFENVLDQKYNNNVDGTKSPRQTMSPKIRKANLTPDRDQSRRNLDSRPDSPNLLTSFTNFLPESSEVLKENQCSSERNTSFKNTLLLNEIHERKVEQQTNTSQISPGTTRQKKSLQNCTLLKQLLSNTKDDAEKSRDMSISNCIPHSEKHETSLNYNSATNLKGLFDGVKAHNSDLSIELIANSIQEGTNDSKSSSKSKTRTIQELRKEVNESVTKPLEIITDKVSNQSSGQDSPRIILKINKTDHGSSAKIITEEVHKTVDSPPQNHIDNTHESDKPSPKKHYNTAARKLLAAEEAKSLTLGKRLRSSRVVETPENTPVGVKRAKRNSVSETSPNLNKESELSLDPKRLKLEQLLSINTGLTITPVASNCTQTSPPKPRTENKLTEKKNHTLVNNDNSKNGNSKLHNILSNLQAKQMQTLQLSEASITKEIILPDAESNTSTGSSDVIVEITRIENCHNMDVQEMIINDNSDFRDVSTHDEMSQDPLEVDALKSVEEVPQPPSIKAVDVTPTPRKRGRPRKIPLPEGAIPPTPPALPATALEERPQRSLRLTREKPATVAKPRGRGRGRGARRIANSVAPPRPASDEDSSETMIVIETIEDEEPRPPSASQRPPSPEDPTSSRIKLPRMTEALDKSSACLTPLSSRRRSSTEMKLFGESSVSLESPMTDYMKSPEVRGVRGRGGRGRGTPRGRTPRGRGRGRGGGKGATYMKETMGIYGRVCGPATTTVELFEEETCMMDDNATPKPSHLLDEDSQSSVKSSTNESSSKMKKSKFADLFDSNKVWHASDVKEYMWPPREVPNVDHQVMMIQEQVAMFLGVKGFKRRYPEIRRRTVAGDEKDYCLRKDIVTEALCDLGATAVDASDVLDIMLSDYPHKYEEYRSYQREKQLTESLEEAQAKLEEKPTKIEVKAEKTDKPEPPKVDPEKTRQDLAAAAIASAAEWNTMANAWRRPHCVDLQSNTIHRRRAPPTSAPLHCRPPAGFYPHALLPGQFQRHYRTYTPDQLRYFPLNTVIGAPPAPPSPVESSSESEGSWVDSSSSSDDSHGPHHSAKHKKLTKVKRTSHLDNKEKEESRGAEEVVDLCRVCKLRLEANRKYTHERFLVCAHCNAKLHPGCSELGTDTIRKCREYPWQCSECKVCSSCLKPVGEDKALFCELCDRAHHLHCVSLTQPPQGRWHCVECSVCKSCGARSPGGAGAGAGAGAGGGGAEPVWHHQTKRGPGGHKVYSHSLCTPCARAYRIGRYCPLCERSFIGPKGTMQLVICKLCDRQLHQECVRATVSALSVLDYTCAECRRGGITSRAAAVRAAPRTIATLFMAKRRFNKYAHRQYMQSRARDAGAACDPAPDAPSDPETDPLDGTDTRMSE